MRSADRRKGSRGGEVTARALNSWSLAVLAGIAVVAAAKLADEIVVPTVLAGMFAITLTPVVATLERFRIPSALAAALVVLCAVFAVSGSIYFLAPSAEDWRLRAPSIIRSIEWEFRDIEREIKENVENVTGSQGDANENSATEAVLESGQRLVTDVALKTPEMLASALYIAFLCYFFLLERAALHRLILSLGPTGSIRLRMGRAMREVRRDVARYLLTMGLINASLGVVAAAVLWQMGLPNPILWGVTAGMLNFMPYIGPLILNAVVFVVGVSTFGDMVAALYPVGALLLLNIIEGNVLTPLIVGRRSRVGPLSIFLAVAFFAWLWGVLGALLAAPLLIISHSIWRRMTEMTVGDVVGMTVVSDTGEAIADVDNIIIGADNQALAVLGVGGFLGIGEKKIGVPLEQMSLAPEGDALVLPVTREQLEHPRQIGGGLRWRVPGG